MVLHCRPALLLVLFVMVFAAASGSIASGEALTLYVAPEGKDTWSGRSEAPNAEGTDGPLATLSGAKRAVRKLRKKTGGLKQPVIVQIAGGTYRLKFTLLFTPEDSGTKNCPITYSAAPGAKVVISGGRLITGWKQGFSKRRMVATLPSDAKGKWTFRQLFVDGRRAVRARRPNKKDYWFLSEDRGTVGKGWGTIQFKKGDIRKVRGLHDAEIFIYRTWDISRFHVTAVDARKRLIRFRVPKTLKKLTHRGSDKRYFLENALAFLDEPGEWFLNVRTGRVYLYPEASFSPEKSEVVAPVLRHIIRFAGKEGKPVAHLKFHGLTFSHSSWSIPEEGYDGHQADVVAGAAIEADFADFIEFDRCTFNGLGRYALWLREGCQNNRILRCEFTDLGGGAIELGENKRGNPKLRRQTTRNEIGYNHIYNCGMIWSGACGIWVGPANYTRIHDNHIHNLTYTGISVGWTWSDSPQPAHHNIIENNHIHNIMTTMGDGGGIYTLGRQNGTVIRNNLIHDLVGFHLESNGIYTDQGSSGLLIENNLVARVMWCGIGNGTNDNVCRNNIVAFTQKYAYGTYTGNRRTWENNIAYIEEGRFLDHRLKGSANSFDKNVYFHVYDGNPLFPKRLTMAQWRKTGRDKHSLLADPLFVDVENGDFSLRPDSPAIKLGFKPLKFPPIGPAPSDMRESEKLCTLYRIHSNRIRVRKKGQRVRVVVRRSAGKITIDGVLTGKEWDRLAKIKLAENRWGGSTPFHQHIRLTHDSKNLYVFLEVYFGSKKNLRATGAKWFVDDGAEICLQKVSDKGAAPILVIRGYASGALKCETVAGAPEDLVKRLRSTVKYSAAIGSAHWRAEWKIPLSACDIDPRRDKSVRFNVIVLRAAHHYPVFLSGTGGRDWDMEKAAELIFSQGRRR